jgi:hypothetical protein
MNTDPTVFYHFIRYSGVVHCYGYNEDDTPKSYLLRQLRTYTDPRRLTGQKPIRISGGSWAEGYGYTRPYNESVFRTSIDKTLAEFKSLPKGGCTNSGAQDREYFDSTMKKIFKVDMLDMKPHCKELTEAWDYFKEASNELA